MGRNLMGGVLVVMLISMMNIGTIRKKQDPVAETQTDPILYSKKMEEIKDGEKGAPSPSIIFYKRASFLADLPVHHENLNFEAASENSDAFYYGDDLPEDVWGFQDESEGDSWWAEPGNTEDDGVDQGAYQDSRY